jgi:hypothetical protein
MKPTVLIGAATVLLFPLLALPMCQSTQESAGEAAGPSARDPFVNCNCGRSRVRGGLTSLGSNGVGSMKRRQS